MAKVIGIHTLELKPGVSEAAFEQFIRQESLSALPGVKISYYKGDRGERAGKYRMIFEVESVERRDQLFSATDVMGEEVQQWATKNEAIWQRQETLWERSAFTDCVAI